MNNSIASLRFSGGGSMTDLDSTRTAPCKELAQRLQQEANAEGKSFIGHLYNTSGSLTFFTGVHADEFVAKNPEFEFNTLSEGQLAPQFYDNLLDQTRPTNLESFPNGEPFRRFTIAKDGKVIEQLLGGKTAEHPSVGI